MNEAEARAEYVDPSLKAAGWGVVEVAVSCASIASRWGRIEGHGRRAKPDIADYVLVYRNYKLAVVEAKAWDKPVTERVGQAKSCAHKLTIRCTYATNGQGIYGVDMQTGKEQQYPVTPRPTNCGTGPLPNKCMARSVRHH